LAVERSVLANPQALRLLEINDCGHEIAHSKNGLGRRIRQVNRRLVSSEPGGPTRDLAQFLLEVERLSKVKYAVAKPDQHRKRNRQLHNLGRFAADAWGPEPVLHDTF